MSAPQLPPSLNPQPEGAASSIGAPVTGRLSTMPISIRTPDQRLRVFVSSTLDELAPERAAVRQAISQLRLPPVLFELGARPYPPRDVYRAYLAQSDIFVGLYWQRYGWLLGAADHLTPPSGFDRDTLNDTVAQLRAQLDSATAVPFDAAFAEGKTATLEQAVQTALQGMLPGL